MPKSKSVQKAARAAEKKPLRNRSMKSATKTNIIKTEKLILNNELEAAQASMVITISSLDKAAKKRVIHPNTAGRRKSHLMKKLNEAMPSKTNEPETTDTDTKSEEK